MQVLVIRWQMVRKKSMEESGTEGAWGASSTDLEKKKKNLPIQFRSALINVGGELLLLALAVFRLALALVSQTDRLEVARICGVGGRQK